MIRNWIVKAKEDETGQVPQSDLLYGITQVREFMECLPGAKSLLAEWNPLGGEVYHYHSKMILKDPEVGGAWEWHQDYGYWYHYGCLRPMMASAMIAVDPAKLSNGCLEVLKGSHHLGRLDHSLAGDQSGADPERVKVALEQYEKVAVELEPGDTLFFHCNLLHCSGQNHSPQPRWAMICCYNAASNNPYKISRHPQYTPLEQVDDMLLRWLG